MYLKPRLILLICLLLARGVVPVLWAYGVLGYSTRWVGRLAVIDLVMLAWALYGWWEVRRWYWGGLVLLLGGAASWGAAWSMGYDGLAVALAGTACMALGLMVGCRLIRVILSAGIPACGVARTVIDEAIHMKVIAMLVVGLLLIVPFLSYLLDPGEQLRYRVQFYLTWTLSSVSVLLSVMTLFMACATICNEIGRKQVYLTLTKPIGRGQYLLGKWLGIAVLNLMLVTLAGGGVYVFAQALRQQPARDDYDRSAVDTQVLVARESIHPKPTQGVDLSAQFDERLAQLRAEDPTHYPDGDPSPPVRQAVQQAVVAKWHTISPRGVQVYRFTGLDKAKPFTDRVQLRLKPVSSASPPDGRVKLAMWLNGRPYPIEAGDHHVPLDLADRNFHVIDLPVSAADARGNLEVRIANVNLHNMRATFPSSVSFTPGKGLELLYQVGRFETNLARALLLIWVRLGFLAMLGLMAGSFLGFPVACLLCVMVYIASSANGFLVESMQYYVAFPTEGLSLWDRILWVPSEFYRRLSSGDAWAAMKIVVRLIGNTFVLMIPSLGDYSPVPLIADGRLIGNSILVAAVLRVGFIWTSLCALAAWLMFRSRELARVTM